MPRTPAAPPVRLTERLLRVGLTIKDDLAKAQESWEQNFRDPIKEALLAEPQVPLPGITEKILGGVRIFLAKTMPKDSFDTARMSVDLSRALASETAGPRSRITVEDVRMLLDTRALVIAEPAAVAALLATRQGISAASFVIRPATPDVPSRIDLKWAVVPDQEPIVGPLQDLPDRVALAAAGAHPDRMVIAPPVSSGRGGALAAAEAIDRANAGRLGVQPAAPTTGVPRGTPTRAQVEQQIVTEIEDPSTRRPRRRRRRA